MKCHYKSLTLISRIGSNSQRISGRNGGSAALQAEKKLTERCTTFVLV